ncbi:TonB-dependent receptor [uncultured Alistipes sp.]|uniref:TonB-dependent receptor n=1 Tax=uncultured Alistipes sp. TaxID=538949 RepID=UPI0025E63D9A|nr:TonB-dependent receptor [uncultured Alistipes sp.]
MKKLYNRTALFYARTIVGLFALCLLALPASAWAQSIDLKLTNVTVKDAIEALNQRENYSVAIKSAGVDMQRRVSVSASKATIDDVLGQIFAGQDVTYTITGNSIAVTKAAPKPLAEDKNLLKGVVKDNFGIPVPGATVLVEGTNTGTTTTSNGEFILDKVKLPATLTVSFIGYSPQTVEVKTYSPLNITITENTAAINEVVVVGYGQQKRVNVTGAVGTISGKDLNNRPVTNTAAALQGADPSLLLTMGSGSIEGKNYDIKIRGAVSLNSGEPLVLVDGIEASLAQVNPNDIESVSVLKDASACSIYGAKASAGVVLITTKNGKAGSLKVNYNGRYGVSWNTTSTDFMTTGYDYVRLTNEFTYTYRGFNGWNYSDEEMQMLYDRRNDKKENPDRPWVVTDSKGKYRYLGNFDWYDYMFKRSRPETEHNISLTGGNDKVNYYVSGRYLYREGLFNNQAEDTYNGYSFRTKIAAQVTPWLHYSNNFSLEVTDYKYGGYWEQDGSESLSSQGILYNVANNISPTFVPVNPDGTTFMYSNGIQFADSPIASGRGGVFTDGRNNNSRKNNYYILTNRLVFDLTRNKDLKLNADYTYRRRDNLGAYRSLPTAKTWNAMQTEIVDFTNGSIYNFYQEDRYYYNGHVVNAFLDYGHTWGKHTLTAVAGGNFEDFRSSKLSVRQKGSLSEKLSFINLAHGDIEQALETNSAYRTLGYFARANYDYAGKYLFEVSARYDGSSRFAPKDRWAFYPSASAGWRISEEKFWEPLSSWWDNAKVRFSYGSLGNQQVSNYYYFETISTGQLGYTFNGTEKANYAYASNPITDGLTWETVITYNLGFDLGFLNNRLNVMADLYIRDTKDMLFPKGTLPDVFGAPSPKENCANMRTKGYEITVSWRDRRTVAGKPLSYGISASLGDYKSKITKYKNDNKKLTDPYVGMTVGEIWGYRTDGLFKTDEEAALFQARIDDTAVNNRVYSSSVVSDARLRAGDVRFRDLNGDNIVNSGENSANNSGDMRVIGNTLPRYTYGIRGDLNWNGIDFAVFFQGVGKIDWMPSANCYYFWGPYSFPTTSFISSDFEKMCWSEDNRNTYFPRRRSYQTSSAGSMAVKTDRYLQDASYIRLKNITLGYTIPINKRIVEKIRVYVSGENLAYWSPLKRYCTTVDPEVATTNATNDCLYPYSRTFSVGVDITF